MSKKILVLYYTQTGQLEEILKSFLEPFSGSEHELEMIRVYPENDYSFPWSGKRFFREMPECASGSVVPLKPFSLKQKAYDLIVLGYQPWFLSPSPPVNSILQNADVKSVLKNTPVLTITGARNMWISALERIKKSLKESGAKHAGNIVLVDKAQNHVSVVTICYWMFSGKKDKFMGFFPKPGVSEHDIHHASVFGAIVKKHLEKGSWSELQNELFENKAVVINYNLMYTELKGSRLFGIWASIIKKKKNKDAWLVLFKYYLIIALFIAAPIILSLHTILVRPFIGKRVKKQFNYYSGVNYN
ncbi:MAG: hypothetical protein JNL60_17110 [Bacteroidia bacterium]|nr:hypothetical protein [Bacteroidia bacterium]